MLITESNLDARLPVSASADEPPSEYSGRFSATIWRTLHGQAPIFDLVWDICLHDLYTAATERNELAIGTDEHGTRILDLYTDMGFSPFTRRTERVEIRGWDLVNVICLDPSLTIRFNQGSDLELRFEATLLHHLGQELQNSREPRITHHTTSVGTATAERTGAQ